RSDSTPHCRLGIVAAPGSYGLTRRPLKLFSQKGKTKSLNSVDLFINKANQNFPLAMRLLLPSNRLDCSRLNHARKQRYAWGYNHPKH
ncbi:MAG TPA: hypothetical protein VE961_22215, partial [Pyrinomonadaceae bacterium]|nr:hypothetical protein [Pyrinomonadaceae bacterium]